MSINITVRPNGTTTGGKNQTIPGDGDIDTKQEAEAALNFLPDGSTDQIAVGNKTYTRAQLIEIRDRVSKGEDKPADETKPGEGASHGFFLEGQYGAGLGDKGHGGGGFRLGYTAGIPLLNGNTRLFFDPRLGFAFGRSSASYKTPGGEDVNSAFTNYGALIGAALRLSPNVLDHRLFFELGAHLGVGGFGTADSKKVSAPNQCTPGDFGRADCEPNAGPKAGNAGTQGLMNFDQGSARGTSGVYVNPGASASVGADVWRGDKGNMQLAGTFDVSQMVLMPKDGHSFNYTNVAGVVGVRGNFGGSAVERPVAPDAPPPPAADQDGDGIPDADDQCPTVAGTKENKGCPAYDAGVTSSPASVKAQEKFLVGLKLGSPSKVKVQFKDASGALANSGSVVMDEGNSKSEFGVPADLKSGKYKLVVTFEDMSTHTKKVEEKDIVIVENVTAQLPGSFAPGQPPTIQNAKVGGMEKLEGVTFTIEGFDKDKKSVGTLDSKDLPKGDKAWTLDEKRGTRIPLAAPGKKGFQKDVNYVVTLKNKEGLPVWTGSFEVGQAQTFSRKVKPK